MFLLLLRNSFNLIFTLYYSSGVNIATSVSFWLGPFSNTLFSTSLGHCLFLIKSIQVEFLKPENHFFIMSVKSVRLLLHVDLSLPCYLCFLFIYFFPRASSLFFSYHLLDQI